MNKKSKTIIWLLIFIFLTVLFSSIATYAYFSAREIYRGTYDIEVTSKGVDTLRFDSSDDVKIEANAKNFTRQFGHDVSAEASIHTILDTTNKEATYCYEISMILPDEEVFTYSKPGTPELLLDISKSNDDVNYEQIISKMDITTKTGTIKVPISKDSSEYKNKITTRKNQTAYAYWKAKITLVWFNDTDQVINDEKNYRATIKANIIEC